MTTEDEYFPPPPELRELLRALATTVGLLSGRPEARAGAGPLGQGPERSRRPTS